MWNARIEDLPSAAGCLGTLERDGRELTFAEVLHLWATDAGFREAYSSLLAGLPYAAFRWETPAVTRDSLDRRFEFAVLEAPELLRPADPSPFAEHFDGASVQSVLAFANLGRDATLVVPSPGGPSVAYAHLAAFLRHGPARQRHQLWVTVSAAMQQRVADHPVWLSTAGAGVAWLHVRLDDSPKYYGYAPFRSR